MMTMKEAKLQGIKAAGQEFACDCGDKGGNVPTGSIGVILGELSARGKLQAELTCVECGGRHVREVSDWHQCRKCETCQGKSGKSKGGSPGIGGGRSVKLEDGTVLRELKINEKDDDEMRSLKEQNNALFEKLYAQEVARREAEKEEARLAREAARAEAREAREAELAAKKKEAAKEALARVEAYAARTGMAVSKKAIEVAE